MLYYLTTIHCVNEDRLKECGKKICCYECKDKDCKKRCKKQLAKECKDFRDIAE